MGTRRPEPKYYLPMYDRGVLPGVLQWNGEEVSLFTVRSSLTFAVVLLQLAIDRLAPDSQLASGPGLVPFGVVEGGFDYLALNFIHRRWHVDFNTRGAALVCRFRALATNAGLFFERALANRNGQIVQLDLAAGSYDHRALNRVFQFAHVAGPVVT